MSHAHARTRADGPPWFRGYAARLSRRYLRDLVRALGQNHEDADVVQAALAAVPRLVARADATELGGLGLWGRSAHSARRSRLAEAGMWALLGGGEGEMPVGGTDVDRADEVGLELVDALLRLEDAFELPGFHGQRQGALVALGVAAPARVARRIGELVWSRKFSLGRRLDMLDVLAVLARDLVQTPSSSDASPTATRAAIAPPAPSITVVTTLRPLRSTAAPTASALEIAARVEAHTRRFSSRAVARRPAPAAAPNRLGSCLGAFVDPLVAGPEAGTLWVTARETN